MGNPGQAPHALGVPLRACLCPPQQLSAPLSLPAAIMPGDTALHGAGRQCPPPSDIYHGAPQVPMSSEEHRGRRDGGQGQREMVAVARGAAEREEGDVGGWRPG